MLSAMSEPPWENRPQQGWGPPAPQQQPGWNQGPYQQQAPDGYPPQYPAHPGGGYDHEDDDRAYEQYPPRDPYPPQQRERHDPRDYPPEPPRRNGSRTAGIVGVCMLLVIGVATSVVFLTRKSDTGSASAQYTPGAGVTPTVTDGASTSASPDDSVPTSAATSGAPTSDSVPVSGQTPSAILTGIDPATLDSAATDKTPFTPKALFATSFTDEKNVAYTLKAAAAKSCDKVGDSVVAPIVKSAKCTQFMAASWVDASGRIVVSAMVIPYPDAATAKKIQAKLGDTAHTGDYNQWCPPAGQVGAEVCTKLTPTATREGMAGAYHRYMLITTAVFVDLRNDPGQADWLSAAANGAFQNILPGN